MINYTAIHDKTQFYVFLTGYAAGIKWYDIVMEWPAAFTFEEVNQAKYLHYQDIKQKDFINKKAAHK